MSRIIKSNSLIIRDSFQINTLVQEELWTVPEPVESLAQVGVDVDVLEPLAADEEEIMAAKAEEMERLAQQTLQEAEQQAQVILAQAQEEARSLLLSAQNEVQQISVNAQGEAENLKEACRQEGYAAGKEQAQKEAVALKQAAESESQQILENAQQEREQMLEAIEPQVVDLAIKIAQRVIWREISTAPESIRNITREALMRVNGSGEMIIKVHESSYEHLHSGLEEAIPVGEGMRNYRIEIDNTVEPGGCIVDTGAGYVDAQITSQFNNVVEAISQVHLHG